MQKRFKANPVASMLSAGHCFGSIQHKASAFFVFIQLFVSCEVV